MSGSHQNDALAWARDRPWYQRPDEAWLRPFVLLLAVGSGMIMGPKIELGTQLVCEEILGIQAQAPTSSSDTLSTFNFLPAPHERPPLSEACLRSPEVEAGYTALGLRCSLAIGILSVITTGFWGGLSDRKGRVLILRTAILGLTLGDLFYITLGLFPQSSIPLGKELLVVGAATEGALGGIATLIAAHLAYVSDVTPNGTRASEFSFFSGVFFFGFSLGPGIGGLVVRWLKSTMAPFYFALGAHLSYLLFATLFLPESRSPERMHKAQEEYAQANHSFKTENSRPRGSFSAKFRLLSSYISTPLRPLLLLAPHRRDRAQSVRSTSSERESQTAAQNDDIAVAASAAMPVENTAEGTSSAALGDVDHAKASASHISVSRSPRNGLDWNLTLAATAYLAEACCFGVITPKISYAMLKFKWNAAEIGYYLSYVGLVRVACLVVVIPLFVKWVHKPIKRTSLRHDGKARQSDGELLEGEHAETDPLLDDDGRPFVHDEEEGLVHGQDGDALNANRSMYGATDTSNVSDERSSSDDEDQMFDEAMRAERTAAQVEHMWTMRGLHLRQIHDSRFDRRLAIGSLLIGAAFYLGLGLTANAGPYPFVVISGLVGLSGGASAALSSLGLALLDNDGDSGKFFAAWSILSAFGQTIVGPILFSFLFVRTASSVPQSIFYLVFAMFVVSSIILTFVRVRSPHSLPALPPRPHTPATLRSMRTQQQQANQDGRDTGPMKSTASRIRLRAPNPFQQQQQPQEGTEANE